MNVLTLKRLGFVLEINGDLVSNNYEKVVNSVSSFTHQRDIGLV